MSTFTGEKSAVLQRLMRALHTGSRCTVLEWAAAAHSSRRTIEHYLHHLHPLGLARIVSWKFQVGPGGAIAVWAFGPGRNAKKSACIGRNGPIIIERSRVALAALEYISANDMARQTDIATSIGSAYAAMPSVIKSLRDAGLIHIGGWSRSSTHGKPHSPIPLYRSGAGMEAKRIAPIPTARLSQHRKISLIARYGAENAARIMTSRSQGGPDAIVQDGKTIWTRGAPRSRGRVAT